MRNGAFLQSDAIQKTFVRMKLPISVIVPHSSNRSTMFRSFFLPSIEANHPSEIIIIDDDSNANAKRNKGAMKAKYPYLFFCDDDILLSKKALQVFYESLQTHSSAGYAYSDYYRVNPPAKYKFELFKAGAYDRDRLIRKNFISTMSLIRSEGFPGFDEELNRFQDWDLWLTLMKANIEGVYVPEALFMAFYIQDDCISSGMNYDPLKAKSIVLKKHGLPLAMTAAHDEKFSNKILKKISAYSKKAIKRFDEYIDRLP
jgi:glycosyltransferase involved in cell wall biosynthesis